MPEDCNCNDCTCKKSLKNDPNIKASYKEEIEEIREKLPKNNENQAKKFNFQEFSKNFSNKSLFLGKKTPKTYKIILTDGGTSDGYHIRFEQDIDVFDFANILAEYFGLQIDIGYEEEDDETLYPVVGLVDLDSLIEDMDDDED